MFWDVTSVIIVVTRATSHMPAQNWKQWIQSTALAKVDLKSMIAKAVTAAMDASDVAKKAEQAKEAGKAEEDF